MFIRNVIIAAALIGTIQVAAAQQGTLVPQPMPGGGEQFSGQLSKVVIPLKWVGGKWVAPFDLINPGDMGGGFPPPGAGAMPDMPQGFALEPMPDGPDGFAEGGFPEGGPDGFAESLPEGAQIFSSGAHYVPDYLIIDPSGEFVLSLKEQTFEDLDLTGAHPLMVASHFGLVVPVPVEMLQFYEDEKSLEIITAKNEEVLDGGEIVGAIGRQFLESFQAVLDQEARTLTLTPPKMDQGGSQH
ncbi:MAG: hypothetical protein L3J58_01905 [Emcibacter sp.]|nr:hypothetical protein [Emcibacter sp.]